MRKENLEQCSTIKELNTWLHNVSRAAYFEGAFSSPSQSARLFKLNEKGEDLIDVGEGQKGNMFMMREVTMDQ